MKNGLNKFAKGMFAIFTIKLLLFGGILIIQSCETDNDLVENNEQKIALKEFESLLKENGGRVQEFSKETKKLKKSSNASLKSNQQAQDVLTNIQSGSRNLFYSYGFTNDDLIEEFGSLNNSNLILAGLTIFEGEKDRNSIVYNNDNISSLFIQSAYSQSTYDGIKHCLFDAFEISAITGVFSLGLKEYIKRYGKKTAIRIIGKFAAKTIGWLGAAWAVADFTYCMYGVLTTKDSLAD